MLSPLPRRSGWAYCFAHSPSRISLPRKGRRVGLRIVLFEACSTFTRVTACTLALSPIRDTHSEGFSYFVTSIAAPAASGWSVCRVGLAPTGKRRLVTAHTRSGRRSHLIQFAKLQFVLGRPTRGSSGIDLSQRDRPLLLKLCSAAPEAVALSLVSNSSLVEGTP